MILGEPAIKKGKGCIHAGIPCPIDHLDPSGILLSSASYRFLLPQVYVVIVLGPVIRVFYGGIIRCAHWENYHAMIANRQITGTHNEFPGLMDKRIADEFDVFSCFQRYRSICTKFFLVVYF